jgi:two-component system C4-dicarboxylate transport sensor histidine kinase DctB
LSPITTVDSPALPPFLCGRCGTGPRRSPLGRKAGQALTTGPHIAPGRWLDTVPIRRVAGGILLLAAVVTAASWGLARDAALASARQQATATLQLTLRALDGYLERYRVLTALLAADPEVGLQTRPGATSANLAALQAKVATGADLTGAARVAILRPTGEVLAATGLPLTPAATSAWLAPALARGEARILQIDPQTGARDLTIAARVAGRTDAVVAVSQRLDEIEAEWRRSPDVVILSDPAGTILLTTRRDWRALSVAPAPGGPVLSRQVTGSTARLTLADPPGGLWVEARQGMPREDWTIRVWVDTAPFLAAARRSTVLVGLSFILVGLVAALVWQRRARMAERIRLTEDARLLLEQRVTDRTRELAAVAQRLETEVDERRATEIALRQTQADLIQSGKLAALGQMSAALSHEINQPLAAVRNFAENAARYIDRGETTTARENLGRIVAQVDRISALARHLRDVARKPDRPLSDVALAPVLAEALLTAGPRLQAAGVKVATDLPDDIPPVRAGPQRLAQVLVNLLSNAADAVEGQPRREITLTARATDGRVLLSVADSGAGVPPSIAHRIFDPFFTTKTVGAGLGLGLSISYNIVKDFGGDLRVDAAPGSGAVFTIDLVRGGAA